MFRLKDGRFEQIGQSWLKHGFFAESLNLCCNSCSGDPTGNHLGVGCSDPYTSSRNGSQGNLGPRSTVNASTGVSVIPPDDTSALHTTMPQGVYECGTATVSPVRPGRSAYP